MGKGTLTTIDVPVGTPVPQILENGQRQFQTDNFIAEQYRTAIYRKIGNEPLPRADQGTRRTAEEFRLRQQSRNLSAVPEAANLQRELFVPFVEICMYILSMDVLKASEFKIDAPATDDNGKALWRFEPENYLVATSKQQRADILINAVATAFQLFPEEAQYNINIPLLMRETSSLSGIPDKFMNSEEVATEKREAANQQKQALAAQGVAVESPANLEPRQSPA